MIATREFLYKELHKTLCFIINAMKNVNVASHYVRLLEKKNPRAIKLLCKNFNCIFNDEEMTNLGKMARAIFNDLIPAYLNVSETPRSLVSNEKVSNIIPFCKSR